jgi:hypothetical protein
MLPGDICVSFVNSSDRAAQDFGRFWKTYPNGAPFSDVVSFFEQSSATTGCDYIVAFSRPPKLVKIADGQRVEGVANTQWIGDKAAYERFREYEAKHRKAYETGRALTAVLFADEREGSPASDLYSTMRNVVIDNELPYVGGFVCVVSNRDDGFRHSVYSDMLADWPDNENETFDFKLTDKLHLGASGENSEYSVCQISTGYMGLNLVAFYLLKGRKLFFFFGDRFGLPTKCREVCT